MPGITLTCDHLECTPAQADQYWLAQRAAALYRTIFAVTSASDGFPGSTTLDDFSQCQDDFPGNPWEMPIPSGTTSCWLDHAAIVRGTFTLLQGDRVLTPGSCASLLASQYCLEPSSGRVTFLSTQKSGTFVASYRAHLVSGEAKVDPNQWSNANRLRVCALSTQGGANPNHDPNFYIGNLSQLSGPRAGDFYGLVDAMDPSSHLVLGGIQVVVSYGLSQATEIFVSVEDHSVGSPDPTIGNRVDPANRGPVVLVGRTESEGPNAERGLLSANLMAPQNITFAGGTPPGGHVSVYLNLDDDPVQF
jgi:hypothetical protein